MSPSPPALGWSRREPAVWSSLPEWQGAGIGIRFLNTICAAWRAGENRYGRPMPTLFHTSHPVSLSFAARPALGTDLLLIARRQKQHWRQGKVWRTLPRRAGISIHRRSGNQAMKLCLIGQKWLATEVFKALAPTHQIAYVAAPSSSDRLYALASENGVPAIDYGLSPLASCTLPAVDVLICAHAFVHVPESVRTTAAFAIGYHPSLLPLYKGKRSIEMTIAAGDPVTGGTVYHLTEELDAGTRGISGLVLCPEGRKCGRSLAACPGTARPRSAFKGGRSPGLLRLYSQGRAGKPQRLRDFRRQPLPTG